VIPAVGEVYEACAHRLAASIRQFHPTADITILTRDQLPHGDLGGYANDWQVFEASPYRQTIKLEADMLCASAIDHLWTMFEHRDVVVSQGCRDIYNQPSDNRRYRKIIDANHLPDVYNAITYWRLSKTAQEFFLLVRQIFEHWNDYQSLLKFPDDVASTDVVYAMAAHIMGTEQVTLPNGAGPQIVHMKPGIIPTHSLNWTQELVWEFVDAQLRINTVAQWGLVHYNVKSWDPYEQQ
jgi:hypothetical protein